jgi:hypothetical protein
MIIPLRSFIIFIWIASLFNFGIKLFAQIPHGAIFWLKADAGITSTRGLVSSWKDQSGGSRAALQPLTANQPVLLDSGMNSSPVVHFDGVSSYMNGPSLYPVQSDYSISIVLRINNFSLTNCILAGATHALYLNGGNSPIIMHGNFSSQQFSSIQLTSAPAVVTVIFRQNSMFATMYINGEFADSGFVGPNNDSTSYLGSIRSYSLMGGDLAEIVLYKKILSIAEQTQLENYLGKKYNIPIVPKPQQPDSTFLSLPKHLQFYQRDETDSALVLISGNIYQQGFDSIYTEIVKDGILMQRISAPLIYESGKASFTFQPKIHAELSEYSADIGLKSFTKDTIIAYSDSIVCGDVILINGQSNAINNNLQYTNEFYRTFGRNYSQNYADTLWAISSTAVDFGGGTEVGSWGLRLQELIKDTYHLPTCIINGGVSGTTIEQHLADPHFHDNHRTIYGSMLYRAEKAKLAAKANVLYWYQGEWNTLSNYDSNFHLLYNAWKEDYPAIKKIYLLQTRMGCTAGFSADLRELQRNLQDSFPNLESFATMGLPGHDGCHFASQGYSLLGDMLFNLYARDFHGSHDTLQISSPNIRKAYFTDSIKNTIVLEFSPKETQFDIRGDTNINGVHADIKDYFYLNDTAKVVRTITSSGNKIFLDLKRPSSAFFISYLPDKFYNDTNVTYEGPWLLNTRGLGAFSFYHVPIIDTTKRDTILQQSILKDQVGDLSADVYPNPSNGKFSLRYHLRGQQSIHITITDLLGRIIASLTKNYVPTDRREDTFELESAEGVYLCRLQTQNSFETIKVFIRH